MKQILFGAALAVPLSIAGPGWAQDGFPVTIDHALGQTVIAGKAERIVTISWMSQDAVIALGETPIGIQFQAWGGDEDGYLPWVRDTLEARGEALPATLDTTSGLPLEQILDLQPDLILAPYSGITEDEYARLSAIAPTVGYADAPWTGHWQDVVQTVGLALGKPEEAEALLAETRALLAAYKDEYPQIEGKTFAFGGGSSDGTTIGIYIPADPRVGLLTDLGLVPAEGLFELPDDNFTQPVSLERLDTIEADVFAAWYSSQDEVDRLMANPLFARWAPIAEGRYVPIVDRSAAMALSAPSPLSIPWIMDQFVPELAETLH